MVGAAVKGPKMLWEYAICSFRSRSEARAKACPFRSDGVIYASVSVIDVSRFFRPVQEHVLCSTVEPNPSCSNFTVTCIHDTVIRLGLKAEVIKCYRLLRCPHSCTFTRQYSLVADLRPIRRSTSQPASQVPQSSETHSNQQPAAN